MPFPSALSSGRVAQLRQPVHSSTQFLLLTPNDIVWQTQPLAQVDGATPYAQFSWDGTDDGDRTDVQVGMTVLISTTTDLRTTFFRGRVRIAPTASTFYINETSVNLETTDYVTVINDYDLHERLERRLVDGTRYTDWDIAFKKLPPLISNLQSSYVDTSGSVASISFAPTVTVQEQGATISTYLWDVADGTITTGTSASKDITVSFPAPSTNEHRWVRFTVTDSEGTSQYFVFEVFTIDPSATSSNVVKLGVNDVSISNTRLDGYNATVRAWLGVSAVLDKTRCTIVSIDDYNGVKELAFTSGGTTEITVGDTVTGATSTATAVVVAVDLDSGTWAGGDAVGTLWVNEQSGVFQGENLDVGMSTNLATISGDSVFTPVTQNVSFIGRLQQETNTTSGDDTYGQVQQSTLNIQGFTSQLRLIVGAGIQLTSVTDSSEWGEISSMTIGRALVYQLAWYSTFLNLCSLTLPSDIGDYDWHEFVLPPASMMEWVNSLSDDINAYMIASASGEYTIQRHASYAGSGGLTTVMGFVVDDSGLSDLIEFSIDLTYTPTSAQAIAGAGTLNTTTNEATVFKGQAPSQSYGAGWEIAQIDQQIMKSDLTDAQARAEVGSRVASHLAYINPHARINVRLPSGYYWLTASDHLLYTFTIATTDNVRGRAYSTSDKWLCVSSDYIYNADRGGYEVSAVFEIVTVAGNYGITVTQVVAINDLTPPDLPPNSAGLGGYDPLSNYPVEDPDFKLPGGGIGFTEPGGNDIPPIGCDLFNVNMKTGANVATKNDTTMSETYIVSVTGDGEITGSSDTTIDFSVLTFVTFEIGSIDNSNGNPLPSGQSASSVTSDTFPLSGDGSSTGVAVAVRVDLQTSETVESVSFEYLHNMSVADITLEVIYYDSSDVEITRDSALLTNSVDTWHTRAVSAEVPNCRYVIVTAGRRLVTPVTGYARVDNIAITTVANERGDAFYYGYEDGGTATAYPSAYGLHVNGAQPSTIPPYNSEHSYTFLVTGTGNALVFNYEDPDYTNNDNALLLVRVCGEGMALTAL